MIYNSLSPKHKDMVVVKKVGQRFESGALIAELGTKHVGDTFSACAAAVVTCSHTEMPKSNPGLLSDAYTSALRRCASFSAPNRT